MKPASSHIYVSKKKMESYVLKRPQLKEYYNSIDATKKAPEEKKQEFSKE
jgi:hypothetical protein